MVSKLEVDTIAHSGGTSAMTIDSSGRVLTPTRPMFSVKATQTSNIANDTLTTVTWGTELFDVGSNFASNTFTAPITGYYQLNVNIDFRQFSNNTNSLYNLYLVTSNRTYQHSTSGFDSDSQNKYQSVAISHLCDMDASDTAIVQVLAENQSSSIMDVGSNTRFSGFLVG